MAGPLAGTQTDVVATPLTHDTPTEIGQPGGRVLNCARGGVANRSRARQCRTWPS